MKFLFISLGIFLFSNFCFSQFTLFNTGNSGLTNNFCWYVNENSAGEVWTSTISSGVFKLSGTTWTNFNTANASIGANYVTPIAFETNNTTWIGTYSGTGGVSKYNGSTWTNYNTGNSGLPHNNVLAIAFDNQNNKWFATRNGGLAKYNGTTWTVYNTSNSNIPDNILYALEIDNSGNIWVGTALNGLAKFDGTTWTVYNTSNSSLPDNSIYGLKYNTATNSLWIGTNNGIAVLKNNTWTIYNSSNTPGISGNNFRGITHSYLTGNTYVAGLTGGISRFDGYSWKNFNKANSNLPSDSIFSINIGPSSGKIWASTYGKGIVSFDDLLTSVKETSNSIQHVSLFPNPATNQITLRIDAFKAGMSFTIYDVMGQVADKTSIIGPETTYNCNHLAKGLYTFKITLNNETLNSGKIVFE